MYGRHESSTNRVFWLELSYQPEKGGWTKVFYPSTETKRLAYYSQFFNTAEMDSTFYEKFYTQMTKATSVGMARTTPDNFQFSVKVPGNSNTCQKIECNVRRHFCP